MFPVAVLMHQEGGTLLVFLDCLYTLHHCSSLKVSTARQIQRKGGMVDLHGYTEGPLIEFLISILNKINGEIMTITQGMNS